MWTTKVTLEKNGKTFFESYRHEKFEKIVIFLLQVAKDGYKVSNTTTTWKNRV